jgi:stringent starvation protein B
MIRAIYEWCVDNGFAPHLVVQVDAETRVPAGFVKDGEIVLNINYSAVKGLQLENDAITFAARFNGVSHNIYVPVRAVKGIFSRENGQGMFFEPDLPEGTDPEGSAQVSSRESSSPKGGSGKARPSLKLVK